MTYHDPAGRLYGVVQTAVSRLAALFDGVAVNASEQAYEPTLALLAGFPEVEAIRAYLLWRDAGVGER